MFGHYASTIAKDYNIGSIIRMCKSMRLKYHTQMRDVRNAEILI